MRLRLPDIMACQQSGKCSHVTSCSNASSMVMRDPCDRGGATLSSPRLLTNEGPNKGRGRLT